MSDISTQLPTLLAVVVGASLSYLATVVRERARWQRERSEQLSNRRIEAYSDYANSLQLLVTVSLRLAAGRGYEVMAQPLAPDEEGLAQLARAEADRTARWQKVLLLGDPTVLGAAREWHEHAWLLAWFARGEVEGHDKWRDAVEATRSARDRFYDCARTSLGVGGKVPGYPRQRGGHALPQQLYGELESAA